LGKRWFAFSRMDGLIEDVMKRLTWMMVHPSHRGSED
jgi:hypothetical protein